jgi:hypothetical protein
MITGEHDFHSLSNVVDDETLHIQLHDCPDASGKVNFPPWLSKLMEAIEHLEHIKCLHFHPAKGTCPHPTQHSLPFFEAFVIKVRFRARHYKRITFDQLHFTMVNKLINAFYSSSCETQKIIFAESSEKPKWIKSPRTGTDPDSSPRLHLCNITPGTHEQAALVLQHHHGVISRLKFSNVSTSLAFCENHDTARRIVSLEIWGHPLAHAVALVSPLQPEKWQMLMVIAVHNFDDCTDDITRDMHAYITAYHVLFKKFPLLDMFIFNSATYSYIGERDHIRAVINRNHEAQFQALSPYIEEAGNIAVQLTEDLPMAREKNRDKVFMKCLPH